MSAAALVSEVRSRGVELEPNEAGDKLRFRPASRLSPELIERLRESKAEILGELSRVETEDEVFDLAREVLGPPEPFDPADLPVPRFRLWVNPEKERFYFPERYGEEGR